MALIWLPTKITGLKWLALKLLYDSAAAVRSKLRDLVWRQTRLAKINAGYHQLILNMNFSFRKIASLATAMLMTHRILASELVLNGGFEAGLNNWQFNGTGLFIASTLRAHSGLFGLEEYSPLNSHGLVSQTLATQVGQTYQLQFWLQSSDFDSFFQATFNGVPLITLNTPIGSSGALQTASFVASGAGVLQFEMASANNGFWAMDDISVQPQTGAVPESGMTLSLLGGALVAVSLFRRRLS